MINIDILNILKNISGFGIIEKHINRFKKYPTSTKVRILAPYIVVITAITRLCEFSRLCRGDIGKMANNIKYLTSPYFNMNLRDLMWGLCLGVPLVAYQSWHRKIHSKNEKLGVEHGSARWGNSEDIEPFVDKDPFFNIILSKTERLSYAQRMPKFSLNRNKHVLIVGGSGTGKTFGIVKPNLLQMHSSYVCTDPKGYILVGQL